MAKTNAISEGKIYLKGEGKDFNLVSWNNVFYLGSSKKEKDPNIWHLVYSGNVNFVSAMKLEFTNGQVFSWIPEDKFSTNAGGKNSGWVIVAPFDWNLNFVQKGNNQNVSECFVITTETGTQFNIGGFHKGNKGSDPCDNCDNCPGWKLLEDGTLIICKNEGMKDWVAHGLMQYRDNVISLVIKEGVTSVANGAFRDCSLLNSVKLPDSLTTIESAAFNNCTSLTSIEFPDSLISIGIQAFQSCTLLASIVLPDSLTKLGTAAFRHCYSLTSAVLPDSLKVIEGSVFTNCYRLTSFNFPSSLISIGSSAFHYTGLTSVVLPDSVTSIGGDAFGNCGITSINLPDAITSIGNNTFLGCSSLDSITLPNSLTSIGSRAFDGCSGLSSIIIPQGVTIIDERGFTNCRRLVKICFKGKCPTLGNEVFLKTPAKLYYCPENAESWIGFTYPNIEVLPCALTHGKCEDSE